MNLKFRTPVFKFKYKIPVFFIFTLVIINNYSSSPGMGSESIADEAEGRMDY